MPPAEAARRISSIHIVPVGALAPTVAESVTSRLSRHVALPCRCDSARLEDALLLLPDRDQADADYLLRRLELHPAATDAVVVGITDADLGLPILTHVFGGARDGGSTAVVSRARLQQEFYGLPADEHLTARRVIAEMLHEVGHLASLTHCAQYDCVMHFSPDVEAIDLRGSRYCSACAAALPAGFLRQSAANPQERRG